MAEFVNPFSGMRPNRPLTTEELIRAIRLDIAAEEEAAHLYEAQADAANDPKAAEVLRNIAKEEIVHVGEFQTLLLQLNPEEAELLNKGAQEVSQEVVQDTEIEISIESKLKEEKGFQVGSTIHNQGNKYRIIAIKDKGYTLVVMSIPGEEIREIPLTHPVTSESKIEEFSEAELDKVAQEMFGENYQDLPDYDHQEAVRNGLKFRSFKPTGKKYKEKDFYTEDAWKMIQLQRRNKNTESKKGQRKMNILDEAKDLDVYKKLLQVLGTYSDKYPGTGVSRMFDQALEVGKKILPKDKLGLDILQFILKTNSVPGTIHKLLNLRFSDLPMEYRPLVKNGRRKEVAHWNRGALVSDKVKDLIDWKAEGGSASWSNVDGEKVKLHDLKVEEK